MSELKVFKPEEFEAADWDCLTLKAKNWYETPEHSMFYTNVRPDWVAIWYNDEKVALGFCAFTIKNRVMYLSGPSVLTDIMFRQLLKQFGCRLLNNPYQQLGEAHPLSLTRRYCKFESDWIIDLPTTFDLYLKSLGKKSRKNLKKYYKNFDEVFDSEFMVFEKEEISEDILRRFLVLHRMRMETAGKSYSLPEEKIRRRILHAQNSGLLYSRWVNGELVSGTLNFKHGSTYYLSTVAHHPDYDKYHLGFLSVADATRYFISQGVKQYNLHVRYSPFKTRLGGKENRYYNLIVFSNPFSAVIWYWGHLIRCVKRLILMVLGKVITCTDKSLIHKVN